MGSGEMDTQRHVSIHQDVQLGQMKWLVVHDSFSKIKDVTEVLPGPTDENYFIHIKILLIPFIAWIFRKYLTFSKSQPDTEHCQIPSLLLTRSHGSCTHQNTTGLLVETHSWRCIIPSEHAVPLLLLPCPLPFPFSFSSSPVAVSY